MTGTIVSNPTQPRSVAGTIAPAATSEESAHRSSDSIDRSCAHPSTSRLDRISSDPRIPAWLVSTIFHTALLILLALLSRVSTGRSGDVLSLRLGEPSQAIEFEITPSPVKQPTTVAPSNSELPVPVTLAPQSSEVLSLADLARAPTDSRAPEMDRGQLMAGGGSPSPALTALLPGGGLAGRMPERRRELGKQYGATAASEDAVELALQWLAAHQKPSGGWSFDLTSAPCRGQCRHGKVAGETPTPSTAATGLAMLAFLGAGYTHQSGPYADHLHRAIYYLRDVYSESQFGFDWQQGSMYGHGIALMALAEALAMTRDDEHDDGELRQLVEQGALFTQVAQHSSGSWGYVPGSPGDTTLTGWQVLSLIATKRNRIPLRTHTLSSAKDFLLSLQGEQAYTFGYRTPKAEPTTTAIGLTMMLFLGESPHTNGMHRALSDMARRGPALTNIYHDYYATLALHHSRHYDWPDWNEALRDHLVATQAKTGHETGSWHFPDRWGDIGGRLYTTAMCAMTLEVYYRYLPLYESVDKFPL